MTDTARRWGPRTAKDVRMIAVGIVLVLIGGLLALLVPGQHPDAGAAPVPVASAQPASPASIPTVTLDPVVTPLGQAVEDHVVSHVHYGDYIREYRYHLPNGQVPTEPVPVIVVLHGYLLDDAWSERTTGFDALADSAHAIVVYPQGLANSWNAGGCCAQAQKLGSHDGDFVHAVVSDVASHFTVDRHRVVVVGFSNGGMLTYQLACADAQQLAGVVIVNGSRQIQHCTPDAPLSMLVLHSRGDRTVPFEGQHSSRKLGTGTPSVDVSLAPFEAVDGCRNVRVATDSPWESRLFRTCRQGSEITLLVNEYLAHQWPKGHVLPGGVSVAEEAWSRLGPKRSSKPFADPKEPIYPG